MPPPVSIVAYAYYAHNLPNLVRLLAQLVRTNPQARLVMVSVLHESVVMAALRVAGVPCAAFVTHDNADWEFGAWQRGLDAVRDDWRVGEVLVALNDTCGRQSVLTPGMLRRFQQKLVAGAALAVPQITGEVDHGWPGSTLDGMEAVDWVRSCLFGLNTGALYALDWDLLAPTLGRAPLACEGKITFTAGVSKPLAAHINRWLFAPDPARAWNPDGLRAAGQTLSGDVWLRKAASILRERRLTSVVRAAGGQMADIAPTHLLERLQYRLQRKANSMRRRRLRA